MRVLGIDPGLTRCGMGVVEGSVGRPLTLVDVNVLRTSADTAVAAAPGHHRARHRRLARRATSPTPSRSSGSSPAPTPAPSWAPPRPAASRWSPPRAAACRSRCTRRARSRPPSPATAAPTRPRSAAMVTRILRLDAPPKPADAADALALAITHIWRGGAQARIDAALAASRGQAGRQPMIAFVRGQVAAVTLTSAVLEVGGVGLELMCTPGTLATLRTGQHGDAADQHGRARGLADPLRLPRRRREVRSSSSCRPRPASAPSWPRRCSPCSRPTTCAARSRPTTSRP